MEKYLDKILIVDGSYMLHRAMKAPGLSDLKTSTGMNSGGVYGFLRMFQSESLKFNGYFPIVCWDAGLSKRRTDLFPDYKANRRRVVADSLIAATKTPVKDDYLKEYHSQRDAIIRILKNFGIPSLLFPGFEGDDLQYLLSNVCNEGVILTDDKDLIQLVSPTIRIRRAMRDELIVWDETDTYYRHPRFTIRKSIIGDESDNIPQCAKGLGEKGADQIALLLEKEPISDYKEVLENYIETNADALSKKITKLLNNWNQFEINYKLIDLHLVTPPQGFETLIRATIYGFLGKQNLMEAYKYLGQYELNSIFPDQILKAVSSADTVLLPY